MCKRRRARGQAGFTLLEMVVVVLLLAVLSGIAVVAVTGANRTAQRKSCVTDWQAVNLAVTAYANDYDAMTVTASEPGSTTAMNLLISRKYLASTEYNQEQVAGTAYSKRYGIYLFPGPEVRIGTSWNTAAAATTESAAAALCSALNV